ncbi:MAG: response regulator [Myxococcota bacterium]
MAVKILAVDDSLTMRKIMEMTFAGEDADVVTVSSGQEAVAKAKEVRPDVVFADASLDGMDGYAVAHAIKSDGGLSNTAVIVLASQHNPYDEGKGKSSGVDDHVAKPFDSQVVIDKVAQVLSRPRAKVAGAAAAAAAPSKPGSPVQKSAPPGRSPKRTVAFGSPPVPPPPKPKPPAPPAAKPPARPVLELAEEPVVPAPRPARPTPAAQTPAAKPTRPKPAPAKPKPAAAASAATAPSGAMAAKLEGLGLSKDQIDGVLALSREVIEQVVWEVVPDLAETLIKEEIKRLTAK